MKLGDFDLVAGAGARDDLRALLAGFNDIPRRYPATTIHEAFERAAVASPEAVAVRQDDAGITYRELDRDANALAGLLQEHGVGDGTIVAVLCDDGIDLATALLGVLKAGGAYCPLDPDMPYERARYVLDDTAATALVYRRRFLRTANALQWDCRALRTTICLDSRGIDEEVEPTGEKMRRDVWDFVGESMFDDISGGGWKSSYTGEWLSREVMDDYGENARLKLAPLLTPASRVLEIGCSSGITMFRLAPLVAEYVGTDLSPEILAQTRAEVSRRGLTQITLLPLAAHEIDRIPAGRQFDLVVVNSVLQCFSGHNYLRRVIREALARLKDGGHLFLGNVFDQDLKQAFLQDLAAYRKTHPGARTKTDHSEELFIGREFLSDVRVDFPEIDSIECSPLIGTHESELSRFTFDALMRVNRSTPAAPPARHRVQLDRRALESRPAAPVTSGATPASLAYVIYTSGTSGRPKGVLVEHLAVARLVLEPSFVALGPSTTMLMTGAVAFDASTFEIWGSLLNGGTLVRAPQLSVGDPADLRRRIADGGITTMWLTASLFNQLAEIDAEMFRPLEWLLVGGERLSPPHVASVLRACPSLRIVNGYGPTENTTFTTCHRVTSADGEIPIGRPVAGTEVLIVDAAGKPVPVGIPGEICAAGDGLARGYLNDPALTAAKFVPHPWTGGTRMYRTGDRGRWREDGVVEYLGRLDGQVKVRGYRIEPAEIEHAVRACPGVGDACVTVVEPSALGASRELVAYVTGAADPTELRAQLRTTVPEYMVPAHIVKLERLPLTANGKVDRRALPKPETARGGGAAPASETERLLAAIWSEVLGAGSVGATDNFFDLGGHSLKVTKVVALVRQRLGVHLPLAAVFRSPTVRELARYLENAAAFGVPLADDTLVVLADGEQPVSALPPGTGDVLGYMPLAARLDGIRFNAFNFIDGEDRVGAYADLVVAGSPGPYVLLGYSSGGNLAFHVALELEGRGAPLAGVIMIDAGRRVRPYPYVADEIQRAAADFLSHETIRPYADTPVLRDKVIHRIEAYYRFMASTSDAGVLDADIAVITCEGAPMEASFEGQLVASLDGWREATRGEFSIVEGAGDHARMLFEPALTENAALIAAAIRRVSRRTRAPR